ncbi:SDR family oxidoreductase [Nocardioides ungokensis]|uniref:SDR family oxidoreductase n=1 Tax=Nocardioides ungokensis TaxID=1643322 RepID=UPI0015E04820|nr:SDR family oxidoreductase [Nocardioides ungokensis]
MSVHVVSGAGSGIGAVLAARLRARGDELWLLARSEARAAELEAAHPGARTLVADLADPGGLERALAVADLPDRLDSLLHVAGVVDLEPVAGLDLARWQRQLDVNLTAPALLTRALLPALRAARGTVVFVNSGAGLSANPTWSGYAASKFGLRALADALRGEEQERGVRVTTVYPGRTATPMQEKVHAQEGKEYDAAAWSDPATVAATILHVVDLPADSTIPDVTVRPTPRVR